MNKVNLRIVFTVSVGLCWAYSASAVHPHTCASVVFNEGEWAGWLGRPVYMAHTYAPRSNWSDIASGSGTSVAGYTSAMTLISIGMLPDDGGASTLSQGAAGAYDSYFTTLAQNLVSAGRGDLTLRPGWEFNGGSWSRYWPNGDFNSWIGIWRHIVNAMRSVQGQNFRFNWCVNGGPCMIDPVLCYPGDEYVDDIGVDVYDHWPSSGGYPVPDSYSPEEKQAVWEAAWNSYVSDENNGLDKWATFTRDHGKMLTFPEYGISNASDHGGGDNPYFIQASYDWMVANQDIMGYHTYFNFDMGANLFRITGSPGDQHFPNAKGLYYSLYNVNAEPTSIIPAQTPSHGIRTCLNVLMAATGETVAFVNLPSSTDVFIYAPSGKLITHLPRQSGSVVWSTADSRGVAMSKGLYMYILQDGVGGRTAGKMIFR